MQLYVLLALRRGQRKREAAIKVGTSTEDLKYRAQCLSDVNVQKRSRFNLTEEGRAVAQHFSVFFPEDSPMWRRVGDVARATPGKLRVLAIPSESGNRSGNQPKELFLKS